MKKAVKIGLGSIGVLGVLYGLKEGKVILDYQAKMKKLEIETLDVSTVKDGVYEGSYDANVISASVRVTVHEGKIESIELTSHKYDRGGPAIAIVDEVIQAQSLDVDVVSGATNSSKTILKAIENALQSDPIESSKE